MTKEEMAKAYANGFDGVFADVAYAAFLCGYGAKCSVETSDELEKAAKEYAYKGIPDELKPHVEPIADEIIKNFIAGAEWQKEQDEKEQADLFTIVALDAAERAKKQMMEEAVEAEVESFSEMHPEISIPLNPTMFKAGDKVRIIIVKEDEK